MKPFAPPGFVYKFSEEDINELLSPEIPFLGVVPPTN